MRIVALTFGTEGDTRPMLALCRGLADAGHQVVALADRSGASQASALGVPFVALAGDMASELHAASAGLLQEGGGVKHVARALAAIARRNTAGWMRMTLEQARGADAIVCAGLAIYVGLSCAEALRIPAIAAGLQPMMPTRAFVSPFLPPLRLPEWANRASHRLVLAMLWRAFRGAVNDARRNTAHQPPRRRAWDGYPVLIAISPTLVPRPPDWDARIAITGYWWPPTTDYVPEPGLAAFLAGGEAPVYVGFGSMLAFDTDRMRATVLDALAGRRALLHAGWSGFGNGALPANAHRIGQVPHRWLFRRVALVVHHGGAGTTHAAAASGAPSVVVPFAADQFFWAERLQRLGIGGDPLPQRAMTSAALGARLTQASEPAMRERAVAVARSMASESGVANAVARIEALRSTGTIR